MAIRKYAIHNAFVYFFLPANLLCSRDNYTIKRDTTIFCHACSAFLCYIDSEHDKKIKHTAR